MLSHSNQAVINYVAKSCVISAAATLSFNSSARLVHEMLSGASQEAARYYATMAVAPIAVFAGAFLASVAMNVMLECATKHKSPNLQMKALSGSSLLNSACSAAFVAPVALVFCALSL